VNLEGDTNGPGARKYFSQGGVEVARAAREVSRLGGPDAVEKLQGNTIDFFVHVLKLSFHDAMLQIIGP
jgi:hypothetical protein